MKSWLYLFLSCNNLLHIKWNISHFSSLAFPPSDKFHVTDPSVTHGTWDTQKEGHVRHRAPSLGRTGRPTRSLYSTYHCHGRGQPSISVTVWHVTQCSSYRSVPAVPLWGGQILLYLARDRQLLQTYNTLIVAHSLTEGAPSPVTCGTKYWWHVTDDKSGRLSSHCPCIVDLYYLRLSTQTYHHIPVTGSHHRTPHSHTTDPKYQETKQQSLHLTVTSAKVQAAYHPQTEGGDVSTVREDKSSKHDQHLSDYGAGIWVLVQCATSVIMWYRMWWLYFQIHESCFFVTLGW